MSLCDSYEESFEDDDDDLREAEFFPLKSVFLLEKCKLFVSRQVILVQFSVSKGNDLGGENWGKSQSSEIIHISHLCDLVKDENTHSSHRASDHTP